MCHVRVGHAIILIIIATTFKLKLNIGGQEKESRINSKKHENYTGSYGVHGPLEWYSPTFKLSYVSVWVILFHLKSSTSKENNECRAWWIPTIVERH